MTEGTRGDQDREIAALRASMASLERRVAALEGRQTFAPEPVPTPPSTAEIFPADEGRVATPVDGMSASRILFLLGRSLLVLAGAFLLRALTDRGMLPPAAGFGLGLGYALTLTALADRGAGRGDRLGGTVHGLTALVIAFPFVWETTAQLGLVPPLVGGLALALLTAAGLAAAWHRRLAALYWAFALGALATTVLMYATTGAVIIFTWLLIALGAATVVFSYGRGWYLARWPVALVLDLVILRLVGMSSNPGGVTAGGEQVPPLAIQGVALGLLVIYLGMFIFRSLVQGRGVKAFDVIQSLMVVGIGYGGAAYVALAGGGSGGTILGWAALVTALALYGVAFTAVRERHGRGRAFFYFATLAMLFLVVGSDVLASGEVLSWSWIALGLAAALLGGHFDRVTLRAHAAVYLILAAFSTGLLAATVDAFLGDPGGEWTSLGPSALVALAVTAACYFLLARAGSDESRWRRMPRFVVVMLTVMGLGYLAVTLVMRLVTEAPPGASPVAVAVIRSAVLAVTAVGLALLKRRTGCNELAWLVYPLLGLGCLKLVFEDLSLGNPIALTAAFALFGSALILAPRILRRSKPAEAPH